MWVALRLMDRMFPCRVIRCRFVLVMNALVLLLSLIIRRLNLWSLRMLVPWGPLVVACAWRLNVVLLNRRRRRILCCVVVTNLVSRWVVSSSVRSPFVCPLTCLLHRRLMNSWVILTCIIVMRHIVPLLSRVIGRGRLLRLLFMMSTRW